MIRMVALLSLLLSACGTSTPPAPQTLPMGDYVYGQILLNEVVISSEPENLKCTQFGKEVECSKIDPNSWAIFQKIDQTLPASFNLIYYSRDDIPAKFAMVKSGNNKCPTWAAGLFTACESYESDIHYLK